VAGRNVPCAAAAAADDDGCNKVPSDILARYKLLKYINQEKLGKKT
jgi:hypothetical protein